MQREHIKLQLEQEKYLEKLESFSESSNQREEGKSGIVTSEEKMDGKRNKVKMFECYFKRGYPVTLGRLVFYNKLAWFVSERLC